MKKHIRKPTNWQDFESLCKKLWGEIWEIPYSIKKNGRNGQNQMGVDIYGIPKNENKYFAIQCKGKDDYSQSKLTIPEIDREISLAKEFKPELKEFIIVTTANKDAKIEEYIRIQNIESRNKNLFSIHIYCWEDIDDLLEEYPTILQWYLSGINIRTEFDYSIGFFPEILTVNFIKEISIHRYKPEIPNQLHSFFKAINTIPEYHLKPNVHNNKSFTNLRIGIKNTGTKVLDNGKLRLNFLKGVRRIRHHSGKLITINLKSPIIQKDTEIIEFDILVNHDATQIELEYHLLARDFSDTKKQTIEVKALYTEEVKHIEISKDEELKEDSIIIKDNIESYYNSTPNFYL